MKEFFDCLLEQIGDALLIRGTIVLVFLAVRVVKWRLDKERSASNKSQEDESENDE